MSAVATNEELFTEVNDTTALPFEDVNKFAAHNEYLIPNEYTLVWRKLVKPLNIKRAAAICSSGEVGLFSILPYVKKDLVLVDHSYKSLRVAMCKYAVLQQHGAERAKELFTGKDIPALITAIKEAIERLPKAVAGAGSAENLFVHDTWPMVSYRDPFYGQTLKRFDYDVPPVKDVTAAIKAEWEGLPKTLIKAANARLDRVTFLHGDLSDLTERGPFDLLYLSNAIEHLSRNNRHPEPTELAKAVRPGGFVLNAHSNYSRFERDTPGGWTVVKKIQEKGGEHSKIGWNHVLYQVPEAA